MKLADVIDLELACQEDRGQDTEELRERDRQIGRRILPRLAGLASGTREFRQRLFLEWLRERKDRSPAMEVGQPIEGAYRLVGWVLFALGLMSGSGTASVVLRFDGTTPVNIVHFLGVFVGLQLVLLLVFPLTLAVWRGPGRQGGLFGFYHLLRWLGERLSAGFMSLARKLPGDRRQELGAIRGRLAAVSGIYWSAEKWLLLEVQKRFSVAFNLGALATALYLVAFSDLAFAWSTTLDVNGGAFHTLVSALSAPWSWAIDEAAPSLQMVEMSRYFRLDGSYVDPTLTGRVADPVLVGGWWPFLLMCLIVYGLLPRLVVWMLARWRFKRALMRVPLDHGVFQALYERLVLPRLVTRALDPEVGTTFLPANLGDEPPTALPEGLLTPAGAVIWGDIPVPDTSLVDLMQHRFGWNVRQVFKAGGGDWDQDIAALGQLKEAFRKGLSSLLILAEAFEAPSLELVKFLHRVRETVGKDRSLVIGIIDLDDKGRWVRANEDDWRIWRAKTESLGDPYLRLERMVEER